MKIDVDEKYNFILTEVYNSVVFKTKEGQELVVCMRDGGFEINIGETWYSIQNNKWYFWDESDSIEHGPYSCIKTCQDARNKYFKDLYTYKLTLEDKKLIFNNVPRYGDYKINPNYPPPGIKTISIWEPNDEFWKYKIHQYMSMNMHYFSNATQLAENCANDLYHNEWLDKSDHFVWEIALEYIHE